MSKRSVSFRFEKSLFQALKDELKIRQKEGEDVTMTSVLEEHLKRFYEGG